MDVDVFNTGFPAEILDVESRKRFEPPTFGKVVLYVLLQIEVRYD